ncbi:MAG TPA: flagellar motor switch protein FliN [Candidatus Babeliales bacterium]|nr:flagellar motor switch protein FliN [Candidatus Babeliales bacterium]
MKATDPKHAGEPANLGVLMQVPLQLTVELGACTMPIAEVLKLGTGSIVELDRAVNHPVDLLVNNKPVARGEIVAIENSFGLRITELLSF